MSRFLNPESLFTTYDTDFGNVAIANRPIKAEDLEIVNTGGNHIEATAIIRILPLVDSILVFGKKKNYWDYLNPTDCKAMVRFEKPVGNGPNRDARIAKAIEEAIGFATHSANKEATWLAPSMRAAAIKAAQEKLDGLLSEFNSKALEAAQDTAKVAGTSVSEYEGFSELSAAVSDAKLLYSAAKRQLDAASDAQHSAALAALVADIQETPLASLLDMEQLKATKRQRALWD